MCVSRDQRNFKESLPYGEGWAKWASDRTFVVCLFRHTSRCNCAKQTLRLSLRRSCLSTSPLRRSQIFLTIRVLWFRHYETRVPFPLSDFLQDRKGSATSDILCFLCPFSGRARTLPLSPDQILLRGAMLKNTTWVFGESVLTSHALFRKTGVLFQSG